jgi:hypothetical protein
VQIEISYNMQAADDAMKDYVSRKIPYATAQALNNTMVDAQKAIRRDALPKVFTRRNKALPRALTTIPRGGFATGRRLIVTMVNARGAGEGFIERQIDGQVKKPKGSAIAIPIIGPGMQRLVGGSIPKKKKPRANPNLFKNKSGTILMERDRNTKKLVPRFVLTKTAKPNRRGSLKYYETAEKTVQRNVLNNWLLAMKREGLRIKMPLRK